MSGEKPEAAPTDHGSEIKPGLGGALTGFLPLIEVTKENVDDPNIWGNKVRQQPADSLLRTLTPEVATSEKFRGTALVTGASSGIGAAVARELSRASWRVVCAARRTSRLTELVNELGAQTLAIALDVTDKVSVDTLSERLPEDWRNIDVLVNSAGHDVGGRRRFDEEPIDEWVATIDTNLIGTARVTHAVVGGMLDRGRGHIVNIGSIFGLEAHAGSAAYAASKFGVNGFSKVLLDDYRSTGVRVTQILPGVARTEFSDTRWRGDKKLVDEFYAGFDVVLEAEDVARCVRFAVEQPSHVTISDLVVVAGGPKLGSGDGSAITN